MQTNNERPRWRLNGFDIVIIAVVLAAAAVAFLLWRSSGTGAGTSGGTQKVHYTIELEEMVGDTAHRVQVGDTIVDSAKKYVMGTVEAVEVVPATETKTDYTTGDTVTSEIPGKLTAVVHLECECTMTDYEITAASGYVIRIGSEIQAAGPGYAGTGYLVAIDRGGDGQ
jgi:hypothetical protein